ncbi:zf-HC2 domain-containing protein [Acidihalobacter yilgarnensis]|uniref:zf-HC2 domain-containing protein n=1 Tax=Acidihalobacter yilgarnensis TaxID=2819280 RepID=UPI0009F4C3E4
MIKCKEVTHHASTYLNGKLPLSTRWSIRFHLLMCKHCQRFVRQLKLTTDIFRKCEQLPLTPTEEENVDAIVKKIPPSNKTQT